MGCGASAAQKYKEPATKEDGKTADEEPKQKAAAATDTSAAGTPTSPEAKAADTAAVKTEEPAAPAEASTKGSKERPKSKENSGKDDEDEEDEDEDDVMDEEEMKKMAEKMAKKGRNDVVSAEPIEADPDWKAPVHEKTAEQEARLKKSVSKSFMFAALNREDLDVVIKAFQETPAAAGTVVIEQGAIVSSSEQALYVVESGTLDVFKKGVEKAVFTYTEAGQSFGELALLYSCPRAATVIAKTDSALWSIDRNTFNYLVKDAARVAVERRMEFLKGVPLLKGLNDGELHKLCDALQVREVESGVQVITKGEKGAEFFIMEAGKAEARIDNKVVMSYEEKHYFGELALLSDAPRAADVVVTTDARLLVLGEDSFKRLLGPLDEILKERAAHYGGDKAVQDAVHRASVHMANQTLLAEENKEA